MKYPTPSFHAEVYWVAVKGINRPLQQPDRTGGSIIEETIEGVSAVKLVPKESRPVRPTTRLRQRTPLPVARPKDREQMLQ